MSRAELVSARRWAPGPISVFAAIAIALSWPLEVQGQEVCPTGVIGEVVIANQSVYDNDAAIGGAGAWVRRLANAFHVRTRNGVIRGELTVAEGACLDPRDVEESERLLRDLSFVARAEITTSRLADGRWAVRVETWDEWTTTVGVRVSLDEELRLDGGFVKETNLLGTGAGLLLDYNGFRQRRDLTAQLSSSRLLGSRANSSIEFGTTRIGHRVAAEVDYPYVGEAGRLTASVRVGSNDHLFRYLTGTRTGISHVLLPLEDATFRIRAGTRRGRPGSLASISGEVDVLRRTAPGPIEIALDNRFSELEAAPDSLVNRLGAQAAPPSRVRLGLSFGLRRLRFEKWSGVDLVTGTQDVAIGSALDVTLGRTVGTWGTAGADSYARLDWFGGLRLGDALLQSTVETTGRVLDDAGPRESRVRDLRLDLSGEFFLREALGSTVTTNATGRLRAGWRTEDPYQIRLGGRNGVRSIPNVEAPAARTLMFRLEQRWNPSFLAPTADLGLTLFADLGQAWAGDAPFGTDTGWRHGVGAGLRVGFPAGTGRVLRVEMAWPTDGKSRGSTFRAYWVRGTTSR